MIGGWRQNLTTPHPAAVFWCVVKDIPKILLLQININWVITANIFFFNSSLYAGKPNLKFVMLKPGQANKKGIKCQDESCSHQSEGNAMFGKTQSTNHIHITHLYHLHPPAQPQPTTPLNKVIHLFHFTIYPPPRWSVWETPPSPTPAGRGEY